MKRTLFWLVLFCQLSLASEWQTLFQAYQRTNSPAVRDSLQQLIKANSQKPEYLFLGGLLETNGEKAVAVYRDVFTKYPKSDVADDALLKIIDYLYVRGLYEKASKYALDLIRYYPNSDCIGEAGYFLLSSLVALNRSDSVQYYQSLLSSRYPSIVFTSGGPEELAKPLETVPPAQSAPLVSEAAKSNEPPVPAPKTAGGYFLQVGVFGVPQNAAALRTRLQKAGYDARVEKTVVQGRQLSAVRVGNFATRSEAQAVGEKLKSQLGLEYLILKM